MARKFLNDKSGLSFRPSVKLHLLRLKTLSSSSLGTSEPEEAVIVPLTTDKCSRQRQARFGTGLPSPDARNSLTLALRNSGKISPRFSRDFPRIGETFGSSHQPQSSQVHWQGGDNNPMCVCAQDNGLSGRAAAASAQGQEIRALRGAKAPDHGKNVRKASNAEGPKIQVPWKED